HDQFGQKRPIPKGSGMEIEFRRFPALPVLDTPLTEGVTPSGQKLQVTRMTAKLKQYGGYIVSSDLLELTSLDNMLTETVKLLGSQAGRTSDTVTRNVIVGGTSVRYAGDKTSRSTLTATDVLTVQDVKKAVRDLKAKNAEKIDGYYIAIVHPDTVYDLQNDEEWVEASKYAGSTQIFNGEVGKLYGVRFVETTEAAIIQENDVTVYATLFIGANAYGVTTLAGRGIETIIKQKGSAGTADPLNQRSSVGWKLLKTAKILVDEYLVRVEHKVTLASEANIVLS
ncbi:MAG: N4-gp56 family major capsid protein, partial [Bacillota bacterium]|nr:N4-gp56 family major capsid protein [Bacillota bacterium]